MKRKQVILSRLCALLLCVQLLLLAGCGGEPAGGTAPPAAASQDGGADADTGQANTQPDSAAPGGRAPRTQIRGGGEDVVTLMVYMCGSDLESESGCATSDINEILYADIGENVNIILETGGASEWQNSVITSGTNQRWKAENTGLELLDDVGLRDMTAAATLTDFITYCAGSYPADRYGLIFWDHGGGTLGGFGVDEFFPEGSMGISDMNEALEGAGVAFDFIGFDACLMATAETTFMVEQHADYMIASQRVEPGEGWYYTGWISELSANTSLPTAELGRAIVDGFIEESRGGYYGDELTLSVIDLTSITALFEDLYAYFETVGDQMVNNALIEVSQARFDARDLTGNYDQVDLEYLIGNLYADEAGALLYTLNQCVVYNGTTIQNHNGLCLYFPYTDFSKVEQALDIYSAIGIDQSYQDFIAAFASLMVGGQMHGGESGGFTTGDEDPDSWGWVDSGLIDGYEDYYDQNSYDGSELEIYEKDDYWSLSLSDSDWEMITDIQLQVFLDDGEGYIELGTDNLYEFDEDGELVVGYDNTWVALDGQIVCFYAVEAVDEEDGGWYSWGVAPAEINGADAEIVIMWDDENPYGYVAGARHVYEDEMSGKGLFDLKDGDVIDFLCDFYTYDEEYEGLYYYGGMTVNGEIEVSYEDVGDGDCLVYYLLYDLYQNVYWTEPLIYSYN